MFVASSKTTVADHPTIADRRLARELGEPKAKLGRRRAAEKDGGGFVRSGRRGGRRDGFQRQECEEGIHQEGLCHHFGAGTAHHMEKSRKISYYNTLCFPQLLLTFGCVVAFNQSYEIK